MSGSHHELRADGGGEWKYEEGDVIREEYEGFAAGGVSLGKTEYRVKWRLRREKNGKRCYLVDMEEGGTHLYTAKAIEHSYEVIPLSESRVWSEGTEESDG